MITRVRVQKTSSTDMADYLTCAAIEHLHSLSGNAVQGDAVTSVPYTVGDAVTSVPYIVGDAVASVPYTVGGCCNERPHTVGEAVASSKRALYCGRCGCQWPWSTPVS